MSPSVLAGGILQQQNEKVYCAFVLRDTEGRKIAETPNRSPSKICRELQRNFVKGAYSAYEADKLYRLRRKRCRPVFKLDNQELRQFLQSRLEEGRSPEQIKGRESLEVSATTIYRAVKSGQLPFEARKHLPVL